MKFLVALSTLALLSTPLFASPPALIRSDYSPGEITRLCDASIEKLKAQIETLKKRNRFEHYFPSRSLLAFEHATAELSDEVSPLIFMSSVSPNSELRTEGSTCEEKVGQLFPTILADRTLYQAIRRAIPFNKTERRLSTETLRGFEKSGMNLTDSKLAELKALKQKLASLEAKFALNLNNDHSSVNFTKTELDGVPPLFLKRLKRGPNSTYVVTTNSTDVSKVMENAKNAKTRLKMMQAYLNRAAPENTTLLQEAIRIRSEAARLLGFPSWADAQIDGRMARNSTTALHFLESLKEKLKIRKDHDLEKLLVYKKELDPKSGPIAAEDVSYLAAQLKKKTTKIDPEKIAEYFPAEKTIAGLFEVYSTLFGVKFVEVPDAPTWTPGVHLYEIRESETGNLRAYFYRDTIPREGKYGHAAAFSLASGRLTPKGYTLPISAIVANFSPPTKSRPSLLQHEEVETLFHEFGHIMHQTLTRAPYASLAGSDVAHDFVEAPSQMLENWVWQPEILKKISSHYETGKPLPDDFIEKMVAARDFNEGFANMRQLLFGLYDLQIHGRSVPTDLTQTFNEMYRELFGFSVVEGAHFPASFGHLMGGYDAGYYGYLWSEVYAADLFSRFQREGLLNTKTGSDYRRIVLESGNMRDAQELLKEFLGRDPNPDAFYRKLRIQ